MYYSAKHLTGVTVRATDGDFGKFDEFFFDDRTWTVRYAVVAVSAWPGSRKVLVSPLAIKGLDRDGFSVELTMQQIRNSPDVNTREPVSRRKEKEIHDYYVWPYYWTAPYFPDSVSAGVYPNPGFPDKPVHPPREFNSYDEENSPSEENHLRSSREVIGYALRAKHDDVGHVSDLLLNLDKWVLRYTIVSLDTPLPKRKVILASSWACRIHWPSREVFFDFEDDIIRSGPGYTPGMALSREFETRLFDYYRQPKNWDEPAMQR